MWVGRDDKYIDSDLRIKKKILSSIRIFITRQKNDNNIIYAGVKEETEPAGGGPLNAASAPRNDPGDVTL